MDDDLVFAEESDATEQEPVSTEIWKVLVVDDEPDIHTVTKIALSGSEFLGRRLELSHAYSGAEAKSFLTEQADIAVVLLDVVMETDDAGLSVVEYVRNNLHNQNIRIVLRTGNPGQAPERRVITEYDINDYKEKSELTAQKLFTLMHSALRSYRDIIAIERNKHGLEAVIGASADIFERRSVHQFAHGVLEQLTALLHTGEDAALFEHNGISAMLDEDGDLKILAATGSFSQYVGHAADDSIPEPVMADLEIAAKQDGFMRLRDRIVISFRSKFGSASILYLTGVETLSNLDLGLLELFARNVSIAFENLRLHEDLEETQREIVYMLGEAVETRSRETGNHVKRVAEISKVLALQIGLPSEEAEVVKLASPLHDVGKIGIPDAILNKPGRHTTDEFEVMKTHAELGAQMLTKSRRRVLKAGAVIAGQHHEKWDGSGYPAGKTGDDIHVYGRITAVADVFDALGSDRCYKKAWPLKDTLDFIKERRGKDFDPTVVDALFDKLEEVLTIRDIYKDTA